MRVGTSPTLIGPNPVRLPEKADPTAVPNTGQLYTNDDSGDTELMYMDDDGAEVQITKDGGLNGAEITFGAGTGNRVPYVDATTLQLVTESGFEYNASTNVLTVDSFSITGSTNTPVNGIFLPNAATMRFTLGSATVFDAATTYAAVPALFYVGLGGDVALNREAANHLGLRNGVTAQQFSVANTWTSATNYERFAVDWQSSANNCIVGPVAGGGGGTQRNMFLAGNAVYMYPGGTSTWSFQGTGHFLAYTDNLYDIGASGATRPRSIYWGTQALGPDGSAAAPSHSFAGYTSSGMYVDGTAVRIAYAGTLIAGGTASIWFVNGTLSVGGNLDVLLTRAAANVLVQGTSEAGVITVAAGSKIYGAGRTDLLLRDTTNNIEAVFSAGTDRVWIGAASSNAVDLVTNNTTRMQWSNSQLTYTPGAYSTGNATHFTYTSPLDTGLTTLTEAVNVYFDLGANSRTWAAGLVPLQREFLIIAPTYATATFTDAVTFAVSGAPNATATRKWIATFGTLEATALSATNAVYIGGASNSGLFIRETGGNVEAFIYCDSAEAFLGTTTNDPLNIQTNNANRLTIAADGTSYTFASGTAFSFGVTPAASGLIRVPNSSTIAFRNAANSGDVDAIVMDANDHVKIGASSVTSVWIGRNGAQLATTATGGFAGLPSCAGAPTGVPASIPTGQIPMVIDSTNSRIYAYIGGAWKSVAVA